MTTDAFPDVRVWWMPDLRIRTWRVYMDAASRDVCIAAGYPKRTSVSEDWQEIASGPWREMWPLFLRYVALTWRPRDGC
jgi:hypothetical protein